MHKIDSNPAPKNWTLYYRDGLPIIGQASVSMRYMEEDEILEHGYRIRNKLSGKFLSGSKETATGKQWSKLGHLKLAIHNVCGLSSYPGGAATDAKNKAKVQAWLDKYEVIEVGGIGNRVMNPGEYLPDAHLAALSS